MPNSRSAKKSLRQSFARRSENLKTRRTYRVAKKTALTSGKTEDISSAYKAIDKAQKKGILKKKSAARHKSRLTKAATKASTK